jgi:aspartyl-tRNA(Asn)/glutamyl-tRNA(Gln) amidotransferase subunit C
MVKFSKEELLKLAEISALKLYDDEISVLADQLRITLEYVEQLNEAEVEFEQEAFHNINVFRDDKSIQTDSAPILAQAPKTEETYFVVPKILD